MESILSEIITGVIAAVVSGLLTGAVGKIQTETKLNQVTRVIEESPQPNADFIKTAVKMGLNSGLKELRKRLS